MRETELFSAYRIPADYRRIVLRERAMRRRAHRVANLLEYLADRPSATRYNDPELARLDDLIGEADRLVRAL